MGWTPYKPGIISAVGFAVGTKASYDEIVSSDGALSVPSTTTAISLGETYTNGIKADGTFNGHVLLIQPAASLGDYKAIYVGAWGAEAQFNDGGGLFRIYGQVGSGGTTSALGFIRANTASTSGISAFQFYTDSDAGTPGPTSLSGADFFAVLNAGKYLATSVSAVDGMHAGWFKVQGDVTSVCNGNVCSIWVDNQMSCTVAGSEYGIFATTGGTVPDAFIGMNTSSSGWASFVKFDSTMTAKAPLSTKSCTSQTYASDKSVIWNINGTDYYMPLYDVSHTT